MPTLPLLMPGHRMRSEQEHGRVRPLCSSIPEICRYGGNWWLLADEGWLRINDSVLSARLDRIAMRLDVAEETGFLSAGTPDQ